MSITGRTISILWYLLQVIIAGACGFAVTMGLIVVVGALSESASSEGTNFFIGIVGGAIAGHFWGRVFGRIHHTRHKKMMGDLGVEVIDNK